MDIKEAIKQLRKVESGSVKYNEGLCSAILYGVLDKNKHFWECIFRKWPKYSGCETFPVPGTKHMSGEIRYMTTRGRDMYRGKYGKLRRELAGFIADELESNYDTN